MRQKFVAVFALWMGAWLAGAQVFASAPVPFYEGAHAGFRNTQETLARLTFVRGGKKTPLADYQEPLRLLVEDPDQTAPQLRVVLQTGLGDAETLTLWPLRPGLYAADVTAQKAEGGFVPGNGFLEAGSRDTVTAIFSDDTPGGGKPLQSVAASFRLAQTGRLTAHLADGSDQLTYVVPQEGGLLVRVLDQDEDEDGAAKTDTVPVLFETRAGDKGVLMLAETVIPGRFEAILPTAHGVAQRNNGRLELAAEDAATFSYLDLASATGKTLSAVLPLQSAHDAHAYLRDGKKEVFGLPLEKNVSLLLSDYDLDHDLKGETDSVEVLLSTYRGDMERALAKETATPGVFEVTFMTFYGQPLISDGRVSLLGADSLAVELEDKNNVHPWAPVTRRWVYDAASPAQLSVSGVKGAVRGPTEVVFQLKDLNLDEDALPATDFVILTVRSDPSGYEETVRFDETHVPGEFEGRLPVGFKPDLTGSMAVEPGDFLVAEYTDEVSWPSPQPKTLTARVQVLDDPTVTVVAASRTLSGNRLALNEATQVVLSGDGLKYWNNAPQKLEGWWTAPGGEKEKAVFMQTREGAYEATLLTHHTQAKPGNGAVEVLGGADVVLKLDYPGLPTKGKLTFHPGRDAVIHLADGRGKDSRLPRVLYSAGPLSVTVVDLDRDTDGKGGTDTLTVEFAAGTAKPGHKNKAMKGDVEQVRLKETNKPGVFKGLVAVAAGKGKAADDVLSGLADLGVTVRYADNAPLLLKSGATLAYLPFWSGQARHVLKQGHTTLEAGPTGEMTLTLHDPDLDHDGAPATEQVSATLRLKGQDEESLTLKETDLPGVFKATMPYAIGTWFDRDGVVQFTGMEPVLLSYADSAGREVLTTQTPVVLNNPTDPQPTGPADDFFLVGLADIVAGNFNVQGAIAPLEIMDDFHRGPYGVGKASFYALGKIKGVTLLEASYDSERRRSDATASATPAPDAYYPVYGDTSHTSYDAVPLGKLYVRVTRKLLDFVLGDYTTTASAGEFFTYTRALSGLKAQYTHRKATVLAFAAQVGHTQALDRIQGQGVSGPYQLCSMSQNQSTLLVHQDHEFGGLTEDALRYASSCREADFKRLSDKGETVSIETRLRDHPEILVKEEKLIRYVDYTVSVDDGSLTLKRPLASVDSDRNPMFLVVRYEYELKETREGDTLAGAQMNVNMGKSQLTLAGVVENGSLFDRTLAGARWSQSLGKKIGKLDYETAWSDSQAQGLEGYAQKLNLHHEGRLGWSFHWMDMDDRFGDENVSFSERGATKHTLGASYRVNKNLLVSVDKSRTENAAGVAERQGLRASYSLRKLRVSARLEDDSAPRGDISRAHLEAGYQLTKKLAVEAAQENISPDTGGDQTVQKVGLTYQWDARTNLYVRHVNEGNTDPTIYAGVSSTVQESRNRRSYVSYQLLSGASGVRNAMLIGTQQRLKLNDRVSATLAYEQGLARESSGRDQDTRAMAAGLEFNPQSHLKGSARIERRENGADTTDALFLAVEGATSDDTTLFGRFSTHSVDRTGVDRSDLLFGMAYRSTSTQTLSGLLSYQRKAETLIGSERIQQSLNAEVGAMLDRDLQMTLRYSLKEGDFLFADGFGVRSRSDLWLARLNRKLTTRWDAQGDYSVLRQRESHTLFRNYGVELGYWAPRTADTTRLAMGYQWMQFKDEDYYTRAAKATGPYFRLNLKY